MIESAIRRDLQLRGNSGGQAIVIFLGDYIDRGPDSRAVINVLLKGRFATLPARFLLGNHEDAMLQFLDDAKIGPAWLTHGGVATLASYGVKPVGREGEDRMEQLRKGLIEVLPTEHVTFLKSLELTIELGGFLFVHAGVRPGRPLVEQRREDLLTIREPFFAAKNLPWRVVHGHTVFDRPIVGPDRVSLDTGAYASGKLACAVIEGDTVDILNS